MVAKVEFKTEQNGLSRDFFFLQLVALKWQFYWFNYAIYDTHRLKRKFDSEIVKKKKKKKVFL